MPDDSRHDAISARLEGLQADVERAVDQSESREHWRMLVRSALVYWLGDAYDAGRHTKDIARKLTLAQAEIAKLKMLVAKLSDKK